MTEQYRIDYGNRIRRTKGVVGVDNTKHAPRMQRGGSQSMGSQYLQKYVGEIPIYRLTFHQT